MKATFAGSAIGIFERLPVGKIKHSQRPVRESIGDIGALVESIREHGLLEPIVVRPLPDSFEVVAGNRRLEACKRLRKKTISCHVVVMSDDTAFEESLVENVQRENMNPIEEAEAFRKYVDDYGYGGVSKLARMIGKSESYVSRRISLLELPDPVMKSIRDGRLSSMIAQELIPLPPAAAGPIAEMARELGLSRDEVRSIARSTRLPIKEAPPMTTGSDFELRTRNRILGKTTATLRVTLMRINSMIESVGDDDWMLTEALVECSRQTNMMMDRLIRMEIRSKRLSPRAEVRAVFRRSDGGTAA